MINRTLFLCLAVFLVADVAFGKSLRFTWDQSTFPDVTGQYFYASTQPPSPTTGKFPAPIRRIIGKVSAYTWENLKPGTYYFAVSAIRPNGETGYSNVVSKTIAAPTPTPSPSPTKSPRPQSEQTPTKARLS